MQIMGRIRAMSPIVDNYLTMLQHQQHLGHIMFITSPEIDSIVASIEGFFNDLAICMMQMNVAHMTNPC